MQIAEDQAEGLQRLLHLLYSLPCFLPTASPRDQGTKTLHFFPILYLPDRSRSSSLAFNIICCCIYLGLAFCGAFCTSPNSFQLAVEQKILSRRLGDGPTRNQVDAWPATQTDEDKARTFSFLFCSSFLLSQVARGVGVSSICSSQEKSCCMPNPIQSCFVIFTQLKSCAKSCRLIFLTQVPRRDLPQLAKSKREIPFLDHLALIFVERH